MMGNYYSNDTYYMSRGQRKRRRTLIRRIRCACNILIGVSIFMMWGAIGGVDVGKISLARFFTYEAINTVVLLLAAYVRVHV